MRSLLVLGLLCPLLGQQSAPPASPVTSYRMLLAASGPSGKVSGNRFVFDQVRNRFVHPQDKSFIVYFEWEGPPGSHSLVANWKGPEGRTISISPEVRIESPTPQFNAYWTYEIHEGVPSGVWTVEIRANGQPAGSHSFELVAPNVEVAPQVTAPAKKEPPALDELYKLRSSLVWVHKLDAAGRRADTASGFVIAPNQVVTAFQAVDATGRFEVEFEGGRRVVSDALLAWNRLQDWALLSVDTGGVKPLTRGNPKTVAVGERLLVFNVESDARVIGGVDIPGRRELPEFGERFQLSPGPAAEAVGGPLLNSWGEVVGVLGGSTAPGARFNRRDMSVSPSLWTKLNTKNAAVPIHVIPESVPAPATPLAALKDQGVITPPISPLPSLVYGGTASKITKEGQPADISDFSRNDPQVWVYTMWQRREKLKRGEISATVFDAQNRTRVRVAASKFRPPEQDVARHTFSFSPAGLDRGIYRVDILWDGVPVWRTFFSITD